MAKRFLEDMIQVKNANKIKREINNSPDIKPAPSIKKEVEKVAKQEPQANTEIKTEIKKAPYLKNTKSYFDSDGYREVIDTKQSSNSYFLWFLVILVVIVAFFYN